MKELYTAEIRDKFGDVESALTAFTPAEVMQWFTDHGVDYQAVVMTKKESGTIAHYSAIKEN